MRAFIFAAVAGLAVGGLGLSGANAMTQTSPAGVRAATEAMDTSALVHSRPYRHWHEWEHRRTFGCGGGSSVEIRRGHRVGGVSVEERERSRTSIHSRTTTRGETSVRGSTSSKTGESTKSSTSTSGKTGTGTSSKSGSSDGTSGRGQIGEKSSTGGSSSGGTSGSSGTSGGSSGQKQ